MKIKGMLTPHELRERVDLGEIETVIVAFVDHYGRLMGKRFDAEFFLTSALNQGTHACDYLLTTDMEMEPVPGYSMANWELGYGDFHLLPEIHTLRIADWLEKTALVFCAVLDEKSHRPVEEAPHSILSRQVALAKEAGYSVMAASELEYYLFQTGFREAKEHGFRHLKAAGYYLEDYHILQGSRNEPFTAAARRHLKNSGVPVENSKGEWGVGQHELNVQYTEILEMADRHMVYKQCLKELADKMGMSVTFMAKWKQDQAGSSCHLHLSLWQGDQNAFVGEKSYGPVMASDLFGYFLGGWMKYVPDVMVFYAPTINSYKRYVDGSWAPTRIAWSRDNRTAGFRVVGSGASLRIECRIPGADCNPYLAFAGALAAGLRGIQEKIDPPECFVGDIYAARHLPHVPRTLGEALAHFRSSDFAKESFGEHVIEHYRHFYQKEIDAFEMSVTDWERQRYFERI
ncbi:MAG: glutamine synthetase [Saprospiraceae bacterium]|nr:glutamine synthetase [Saprospiraceae bacterium]